MVPQPGGWHVGRRDPDAGEGARDHASAGAGAAADQHDHPGRRRGGGAARGVRPGGSPTPTRPLRRPDSVHLAGRGAGAGYPPAFASGDRPRGGPARSLSPHADGGGSRGTMASRRAAAVRPERVRPGPAGRAAWAMRASRRGSGCTPAAARPGGVRPSPPPPFPPPARWPGAAGPVRGHPCASLFAGRAASTKTPSDAPGRCTLGRGVPEGAPAGTARVTAGCSGPARAPHRAPPRAGRPPAGGRRGHRAPSAGRPGRRRPDRVRAPVPSGSGGRRARPSARRRPASAQRLVTSGAARAPDRAVPPTGRAGAGR